MNRRVVVLLIAMLMLLLVNVAIAGAQPVVGSGSIYIRRGYGDIYLFGNGGFRLAVENRNMTEMLLHINYSSVYLEPRKMLYTFTISANSSPVSVSESTEMDLRLSAVFSRIGGGSHGLFNGELSLSSQSGYGLVRLNITVDGSYSQNWIQLFSIRGFVDVDKTLLPRDIESYLPLYLGMINANIINMQLAQSGMSWMKFSNINISLASLDNTYRFYIDLAGSIDNVGLAIASGLDVNEYLRCLNLSMQISSEMKADVMLHIDRMNATFVTLVTGSIEASNLESIFRELYVCTGNTLLKSIESQVRSAQEASSTQQFMASSGELVLQIVKPLKDLVLLPSNSSFYLHLSTAPKNLEIEYIIGNIRIGHANLTGEEGETKAATTIYALFDALKDTGIPIEIQSDVPIDYSLASQIKSDLISSLTKLGMRTSTVTRAFTTTPIGVSTAPTTITVTFTLEKTVTTVVTSPRTILTTALETITNTLTIPYITTFTYTYPLTLVTTATSTKTETTTAIERDFATLGIAAMVSLVAGLVIGYAIKRGK